MKKCPPGVLTSKELAEIEKLPNTRYGKTLYTLAAGYFKEARPWPHRSVRGTVLRNLTKRIYVRGDVVMEELELWTGHVSNVLLANNLLVGRLVVRVGSGRDERCVGGR